MITDTLVETLFFTAHHIGVVDDSAPFSAAAIYGKVGFGSLISLGLVGDKTAHIQRACFKAYGPPVLIAAAEYLCRNIETQPIAMLEMLNAKQLQHALTVEAVYLPELLKLAALYQKVLEKLKLRYVGY